MYSSVCLNCVIKHLSQAMVVHEEEVPMGYPEHIYRVYGHLAEASRESVALYPELANTIRDHRLALIDDPQYTIPYNLILNYVNVMISCLDSNLDIPAMPSCATVKGATILPKEPTIGPFSPPSALP